MSSSVGLHKGVFTRVSFFATFSVHTNCTDPPSAVSCGSPACSTSRDKQAGHVVRWVWSLALCVGTPYFLTAVQALWTLCFKRKLRPRFPALLLVRDCVEH